MEWVEHAVKYLELGRKGKVSKEQNVKSKADETSVSSYSSTSTYVIQSNKQSSYIIDAY